LRQLGEKEIQIIAEELVTIDSVPSDVAQEVLEEFYHGTTSDGPKAWGGPGYVNGLGFEPKVVGYAFDAGFQPNTMSPAIKGTSGVYYITVVNRQVNPLPEGGMLQMILAQQRRQQEMQLRNSVGQMLMQDVAKKADVTYSQDNF